MGARSQLKWLLVLRMLCSFPGLKEGDGWCLCASRWVEALKVRFVLLPSLPAWSLLLGTGATLV
jgi:uncharacterized protein (DUF2237 family)